MVALGSEFDVPVYGVIATYGGMVGLDPAAWRAAALNIQSVDAGVYTFNFAPGYQWFPDADYLALPYQIGTHCHRGGGR